MSDSVSIPNGIIKTLKEQGKDWPNLLALLLHYLDLSKIQKTDLVRDNKTDTSRNLGWGLRQLTDRKSVLVRLGYIANAKRRDGAKKIIGWYVQINADLLKTTNTEKVSVEMQKSGRKNKKRYGIKSHAPTDTLVGRITCGDCLQLMPHIPAESVNLICTDLPYGATKHHWDSVIPISDMWSEFYRVLAPNGAIVLFSSQPFSSVLIASNLSRYKHSWVWDKTTGGSPLNVKIGPRKIHEDVLVFGHAVGKTTYNPQMVPRPKPFQGVKKGESFYGGKRTKDFEASYTHYFPTTILKFSKRKEEDGFLHPSQKPVELVRYLIRTYSHTGATVLDCCCGSGSTGVASIKEDRQFIMMEADRKYCTIANERIAGLRV